MHVTAGKKCVYIGNCTFAHSAEEKDLWIFMKENNSRVFTRCLDGPLAPSLDLHPPSLPLHSFSCRLGAALWAVAAVAEGRLGWGDGQQRSQGQRQTDPHAIRRRGGSGESLICSFSWPFQLGILFGGSVVTNPVQSLQNKMYLEIIIYPNALFRLLPGGQPLLAVRQELQQREAVAAAHHLGKTQRARFQLGRRSELLAVPLSHRHF